MLLSLFRPIRIVLAIAALWIATPARAQVTIVFWSQELGSNFPHAFFTLKGTPEAGGEAVDTGYGFTAKALTPAILWGTVGGMVEVPKHGYIMKSNAHFSLQLTDAQYASIRSLAVEWSDAGDSHYNLNRRNCVHFVAEAARRAGLTVVEPPKLMKKPRSFLQSVARDNAAQVAVIEKPAKVFLAAP